MNVARGPWFRISARIVVDSTTRNCPELRKLISLGPLQVYTHSEEMGQLSSRGGKTWVPRPAAPPLIFGQSLSSGEPTTACQRPEQQGPPLKTDSLAYSPAAARRSKPRPRQANLNSRGFPASPSDSRRPSAPENSLRRGPAMSRDHLPKEPLVNPPPVQTRGLASMPRTRSTARMRINSARKSALALRHNLLRRRSALPLAALACLTAAAAWASGPLPAVAQQPPNFVVLIADDMAWDDCSAYGHPHIQTPHLQRLAAQGMRFDHAYLTCSSCSPSRSSIVTGRYPHATGAGELHQPLPGDQVLLTSHLRAAGYYTAAAGKWHLGPAAKKQFDLVREGGGPGGEDHWVSVLRQRPREKPFFCWFAATDPHRDYQPGAIPKPHRPQDVVVPQIFPDTPAVRADLALYYDEISRFDSYVGKVLDELRDQGVADSTFVVVLSDNGRPFPRCKTRVNVDGVRTPFLVRYPPLAKAGTTTRALVSTVDLAATILELAGISAGPTFQGVSFAAVLKDPAKGGRTYAFAEHNWHDYRAFERAVYSQQYVYIRNWATHLPGTPPADAVRSPTYREMLRLHEQGQLTPEQAQLFQLPRPEHELYDIERDPHCLHNLSADPAYRSQLEQLQAALAAWQDATNDSFPGVEQLTPDRFDRQSGKRLAQPSRN